MIQIVTGKLGAGKTLYTVCLLFDALCKGRTVVTNIQVKWPELQALAKAQKRLLLDESQLVRINPEKNKNWHEIIPFGTPSDPVEVFLDEIHLFFNARDWSKTSQENRGLLSFLTQSRKAGVNVTFIAQEITTVEKQFRVLAEWELFIQSSDHIKFGPLGSSPFRFFMVIKRDTVQGTVLGRSVRNYNSSYFALYGSYSFLDEAMSDLYQNAEKVQRFALPKISYFSWFKLHLALLFHPFLKHLPKRP